MMSQIDTLKDQALHASAAADWPKLGVLLGTLERLWTDNAAAQAFYAQLEKGATTRGAPANLIPKPAPPAAKAKKAAPALSVPDHKGPGSRPVAKPATTKPTAAASTKTAPVTAKTVAASPVKPAAKPASAAPVKPVAASPAKPATGDDRLTKSCTTVYRSLLCPHGFEQVAAAKPGLLAFKSSNTTVVVTIPAEAGAAAAYAVTRDKKTTTGAGRHALADFLKLPRVVLRGRK
jgi:hypothetical protein